MFDDAAAACACTQQKNNDIIDVAAPKEMESDNDALK